MGRRRWCALAVVAALLAGCGDDGGGPTPEAAPTTGPATWCDDYDALRQSDAPLPEVIARAPAELRAPLDQLEAAAAGDPEDIEGAELGQLTGAVAAIEAWGHEHCGAAHPFCSLWIAVKGSIAASAFADTSDDPAEAAEEERDLVAFVGASADALTEHAPAELRGDVATFLETFGDTAGEAAEREAEAAADSLDGWTRSNGCDDV
jgi:hypothetical protein